MNKQVCAVDGSIKHEINLADEVFNIEISDGSIYHALKNELANIRLGTASTKGRSEVRGSGAKPWRQKGTGRARSGTRSSPVWVGGGVVFGPKLRDYSYKLPKKVKRLAIKSILSLKNKEDRISIIEDFTAESGKTKELLKVLKNFFPDEKKVIILHKDDAMLKRAGKNLPNLTFLKYDRLRAHDLFYGKRLLILETAVLKLNEFYGVRN
jgi:large subunit ribosomal protein L4